MYDLPFYEPLQTKITQCSTWNIAIEDEQHVNLFEIIQ